MRRKPHCTRRGARGKARLTLEALEARLAPTVRVWDGGSATSANWTDRFNWVGDAAPVAGDDLVFPGAALQKTNTNDFAAGTDFSSLSFNGTGYTLQGNRVRLGLGGLTLDDQTGAVGTSRIELPLELPGLRNFTSLNPANGFNALTVTGTISGTGGIDKRGAGFIILAGANIYAGATEVREGTLVIDDNAALGATGAGGGTEVLPGATLEISHIALSDHTVAEPLTLSGGTLFGGVDNTWTGAINLAAPSTITGSFFTISGAISGGAAANLSIPGDVTLTAANTYQGFTTITGHVAVQNNAALGAASAGTRLSGSGSVSLGDGVTVSEPLFLNSTGAGLNDPALGTGGLANTVATWAGPITVEGNSTIGPATSTARLNVSGVISGNAAATLIKAGFGEVRYTGTAVNTFAGTTQVASGLLQLNRPGLNPILGPLVIAPRPNTSQTGTVRLLGLTVAGLQTPGSGSNQIANAVPITIGPGDVLDLNDNNDAVGGLNMTAGTVQTGIGTLVLGGDVTTNASDASSVINGRLNLGAAPRTFTVAAGPGTNVDLVINAVVSGATGVNLVKAGAGILSLGGANVFDGNVVVNQGFLNALNAASLGSAVGGTVVNDGATLRLFNTFTTAENLFLSGAGPGGVGALVNVGNHTLAGTVRVNSDSTVSAQAADTLTVTGAVRGQQVGLNEVGHALTKIGTGTLAFAGSAVNTNPGATRVFDGTLVLNKSVANAAVSGNLFIGDGDGGETVRLDAANQIADTRVVVINNTLFNLNGKAETIGGLDMTAGQVLAIGPALTINGNVASHASADAAIILGNISLGDGPAGTVRTFTVEDGAASADLAVAGTITDGVASTIGLDKAGAGALVFNGALLGEGVNPNTYGGQTRVLDGELRLNHADGVVSVPANLVVGDGVGAAGSVRVVLQSDEQIPNARAVTVNRDGLLDLSGNDETITNLVLSGGRVETGAGVLTVLGTVTSLANATSSVINGKMNLPVTGTVFSVADGAAAEDLRVNAVISGAGGLAMNGGTGRLVFPSADTYTGDTVLRAGVLDLAETGSLANSRVVVNAAAANIFTAVLVGGGTVKSLDVFRGVVSPDGVLTVLGTADFLPAGAVNPQAVLDLLVTGATPPALSQLVANGGLDIGNGTTQLQVRLAGGFDPAPGTILRPIANNSGNLTTGRFAGLPNDLSQFNSTGPGAGDTRSFLVDYAAEDGNDIDIIRNTAAMIQDVATTRDVNEGSVATFTGQLVDPDVNDQLFLRVNWGDGAGYETFRPGRDPFTLTHRYRDDGPTFTPQDDYVVTFIWGDGSGEQRFDTRVVTVHNVAPVVSGGGDATIRLSTPFVRAGSFADAGVLDTHTATVDYGDGTGVLSLPLRNGQFNLIHRYLFAGEYTVTVTVTDDDGGVGRATFKVTVAGDDGGGGGLLRSFVGLDLDGDGRPDRP
jgi:autotransporter-associated beta strand protein